MSTISRSNFNQFQQSFRRVDRKRGFYDSFYENFIAQSDEIGAFFHARDMDQLKHKLQVTLQMVDAALSDKPGVVLYLQMLGRIHERLHVQQRHFEMWKAALLQTVADYDDEYGSQVRAAWVEAIDTVIDLMFPEGGLFKIAASQ
jgi:hemoglobin-like flavoprotein